MKILLLNPHIDAEHNMARRLQSLGVALLFPADSSEAVGLLKLHGTSIDLAIIHREGYSGDNSDLGLKFVSKAKSDPLQSDLPIILTTEAWSDAQCSEHQKGPEGVNAYLRFPFSEDQLVETIEAVLGVSLGKSPKAAQQPKAQVPAAPQPKPEKPKPKVEKPQTKAEKPQPSKPPIITKTTGTITNTDTSVSGPILEDASHVFMRSEEYPVTPETNISLEMPDPDLVPPDPPNPEDPPSVAPEMEVSEASAEPAILEIASAEPPQAEIPTAENSQIELPQAASTSAGLEIALTSTSVAPFNLEALSTESGSESASMSLEEALEAGAHLSQPELAQEPELSIPTAAGLEFSLPTAISPAPHAAMTSTQLPPMPDGDEIDPDNGLYPAVGEQEILSDPGEPSGLSDQEAADEMPYLFGGGRKKGRPSIPSADVLFAEPMGDAVVPGGAAQTPDLETLKKYLLLREQDVGVLSNLFKASQDQIKTLEQSLKEEKAKTSELDHISSEQQRRIEDFEREKSAAMEGLQSEMDELRFQLKAKNDKARVLENQVREASEEMEHLKERVRTDIRKIRVREKELENRLEIMKKDSEALMSARENKIIELKRKLDLLEFNMDLLQDQYSREKETSAKLRERLARAAQIVRVAGGLLDSPKGGGQEDPSLETDEGESNGEKERDAS